MFKLNGIDNKESFGNTKVGETGEFRYDGTMFYFRGMHSSRVKSIEVVDKDLIVQTKNTRYVFVKVEDND